MSGENNTLLGQRLAAVMETAYRFCQAEFAVRRFCHEAGVPLPHKKILAGNMPKTLRPLITQLEEQAEQQTAARLEQLGAGLQAADRGLDAASRQLVDYAAQMYGADVHTKAQKGQATAMLNMIERGRLCLIERAAQWAAEDTPPARMASVKETLETKVSVPTDLPAALELTPRAFNAIRIDSGKGWF